MTRRHHGTGRWLSAIVLGFVFVFSGPAYGGPITGIVSFGDSLSDVGNYYAATGGASPPAAYGYDQGRFTNGMNWIGYLARDLGIAVPTASVNGGTDYAYGGALTGSGYTSSTFLGATATVPNIGQQIDNYLAAHTPTAGQLFTIWGGGNDVLNGGQTNPLVPLQNIATEITTLAQAGAKDFVVANLPSLNLIPAAADLTSTQQAGLAQFSAYFNQGLQSEAASLQQALGVQIHVLDVYSLVNNVIADPSRYGFTNVTNVALLSNSNGNGFLFWDTVHPTTQADQMVGGIAAQSVPEPSSLVLLGTALLMSYGWARRRRSTPSIVSAPAQHTRRPSLTE